MTSEMTIFRNDLIFLKQALANYPPKTLFDKTQLYLKDYLNFILNHYFGKFSTNRRQRFLPLTPIRQDLERLNLKGKKVLVVVAHCDDETIWANAILTSNEPLNKDLLVVFNGDSRNQALKKVALLSNTRLTHLKLTENQNQPTQLAIIDQNQVKIIKSVLKRKFRKENFDYVFTHNEFGEYGHGHHRQVHQLVCETLRETKSSCQPIFFGYACPMVFADGQTPWPKTLKVFTTNRPWSKSSDGSIQPFSGIFRFKKYPDYFYHDTNCYLPQKNPTLRQDLVGCYARLKDAWIDWLKPNSHYYKYLAHSIQYFYDPILSQNQYLQYPWPTFRITPKYPKLSKGSKYKRIDVIRALFDEYLLDYLHFENKVLWIGWDEFCVRSHYRKRLLAYAQSLDLLDINPLRQNSKIYGSQTINILGDIGNLKGKIADKTYDGVMCNGVLEFVDSIPKAISECQRILKDRGRLFLGIPGYDWDWSGTNRPQFREIISQLEKNHLLPIEVWRHFNPDYYYIHAYKPVNG